MKKILIISTEFPPGPGGIGYHAYSLALSLFCRGYGVSVMSPADFVHVDEVKQFDEVEKFEIIRYQRIGWKTYFTRWRVTRAFLKKNSVDIVILTGKFSLWQGFFIKKLFKGLKTLNILHGSEVNLSNVILRKFTHLSIDSSDILVTVSNFTTSLLPDWIRINRDIVVIPNGIFIEKHLIESTPEKFEFLEGYPKLLTVGHVSLRKGQHRVIKALPELILKFPQIKYHVVGRPIIQSQLEGLAKSLGVSDHVCFHGRVKDHSELSRFYLDSDIFMLLSENQNNGDVEGFGIVALEANQFGVPVIGALKCGVEDAVKPGKSGYLVNGDNAQQIVKAVEKCLLNKVSLKSSSKEWALCHHWNEIVKEYEILF